MLADGDIHVYGALNGRALAGLGVTLSHSKVNSQSVENSPRIFTSSFGASLVGIGDEFVVPDDFPQLLKILGKQVSIHVSVAGTAVNTIANNSGSLPHVIVDCASGNKMVFTMLS